MEHAGGGHRREEHGGHGMGQRGVTRMEHHGATEGEERARMMREHHRRTLWIPFMVILLGVWLMAAPATFSYAVAPVEPAADRWTPMGLMARASALLWSDLISGAVLVVLGWRMLTPRRPVTWWAACFVGVWLQFAPLLFWSPSAAGYVNDTLVGALVIALTILIPGMPGMMAIMKMGPEVPPGWSYNPSSWPQRAIMIALGFAGWLVSRYLAAYQLGYIDRVWEPFFGDGRWGGGSRRVLTSDMSEMWPISDGGLGAATYTFEFLMGFMGGTARWRTMPWMVLFFGILVVPLGLTHIVLVISQPVVVGAWCTLCLAAAAIMLPMIPLTLDEVTAMCQFVARRVREGDSFWRVFWLGGTVEGGGPDERSPGMEELPARPGAVARASVWGVSVPWTLAASAALGLWMMGAPGVFGTDGWAAHSAHLAGALAVVVAVIAMGEVVRIGRWLNVPLGLWLAAGHWVLDGAGTLAAVNATAAGLAVAGLSVPRGVVRERYGSWGRWVR